MLVLSIAGCGSADAPTPEPAEPAPAARAEPAEPSKPAPLIVAGTIEAPEDLPPARALFVSVRPRGLKGPPLAARRYKVGPFPLAFELTEAHRPMVVGSIPEELDVKVTLDVDGNPMVRSAGDVNVEAEVARGARDVAITLAP